jgi:hypothetical protein
MTSLRSNVLILVFLVFRSIKKTMVSRDKRLPRQKHVFNLPTVCLFWFSASQYLYLNSSNLTAAWQYIGRAALKTERFCVLVLGRVLFKEYFLKSEFVPFY